MSGEHVHPVNCDSRQSTVALISAGSLVVLKLRLEFDNRAFVLAGQPATNNKIVIISNSLQKATEDMPFQTML